MVGERTRSGADFMSGRDRHPGGQVVAQQSQIASEAAELAGEEPLERELRLPVRAGGVDEPRGLEQVLERLAFGVCGEPAGLPVVKAVLRPRREVEVPADQQGRPPSAAASVASSPSWVVRAALV
ncbi:hypothetical protein GCM10010215_74890 [Streptomyces virginiae]|uniref:Uncharacterized protein n=1 Tax=Streptomyces virginiae TaxID=1961 RepID=A0ABQ3NNV8_STRVG|nr:hypothetical protein GCM10010215_74890 [Streptomyces virginiae]GHI14451.1 hypothetical protein Scinn_39140 [Streptomyces virginiae]GLV96323.1 hypothetical protein Slala04_77760 [Streptomyces lavendulae subsp. lavendulae]